MNFLDNLCCVLFTLGQLSKRFQILYIHSDIPAMSSTGKML